MTPDRIQEIRQRLHDYINERTPGGCKWFSLGPDNCPCPRCDIDRLVATAEAEPAPYGEFVVKIRAAATAAGWDGKTELTDWVINHLQTAEAEGRRQGIEDALQFILRHPRPAVLLQDPLAAFDMGINGAIHAVRQLLHQTPHP